MVDDAIIEYFDMNTLLSDLFRFVKEFRFVDKLEKITAKRIVMYPLITEMLVNECLYNNTIQIEIDSNELVQNKDDEDFLIEDNSDSDSEFDSNGSIFIIEMYSLIKAAIKKKQQASLRILLKNDSVSSSYNNVLLDMAVIKGKKKIFTNLITNGTIPTFKTFKNACKYNRTGILVMLYKYGIHNIIYYKYIMVKMLDYVVDIEHSEILRIILKNNKKEKYLTDDIISSQFFNAIEMERTECVKIFAQFKHRNIEEFYDHAVELRRFDCIDILYPYVERSNRNHPLLK